MEAQEKNQLLSQAYSFLQQQSMGAISTVAQDNTPESASVNYMIDENWNILILTNKDSRKVQNIQKNKNVAFVVGVAQIPQTAQIQATAEIIDNENLQYETTFNKFKSSGKLDRDPIYNIFSNNFVILKLQITWLRWLFFESGTGKEVYNVLIP